MDHLTITPQSVGSGGEQHVSSVNTEMIEFVVCKMFVFSCYENASTRVPEFVAHPNAKPLPQIWLGCATNSGTRVASYRM